MNETDIANQDMTYTRRLAGSNPDKGRFFDRWRHSESREKT